MCEYKETQNDESSRIESFVSRSRYFLIGIRDEGGKRLGIRKRYDGHDHDVWLTASRERTI